MSSSIFHEINRERTRCGLKPLKWDERIQKVAQEKCRQMADTKCMGHEGFKERTRLIKRQIKEAKSVGENVGCNILLSNPEKVIVQGWIKSPEHYKIIVGDFHLTGVAAHRKKLGKYYFTQIFVRV